MKAILTGCGCWQLVADQPNEVIATQNNQPILTQGQLYISSQQSAALPNGVRESDFPTVAIDNTSTVTGLRKVNGVQENVNYQLPQSSTGGYEWISDGTGAFILPDDLPTPKKLSYGGSTFTRSQFNFNLTSRTVTLNPDFTLDAGQIAVVDF